jgi:hypothetical protein
VAIAVQKELMVGSGRVIADKGFKHPTQTLSFYAGYPSLKQGLPHFKERHLADHSLNRSSITSAPQAEHVISPPYFSLVERTASHPAMFS